jgi:hypothetical protein
VRADCARRALLAVTEELRDIEATAGRRCPSPRAAETARDVRERLLPRAGACVGQDGPLDVEWAMAHSAVLSLAVCLDCARPADERVARCRRARDIAARAAGGSSE